MKIEGLDAFILLDNVLQKEQTPGALILRKASERARQFIDSLDSFGDSIELDGLAPTPRMLRGPLESLLAQSSETDQQIAAGESINGPVLVQVHLSTQPSGTLSQISLARALYTLSLAGATGTLTLKQGNLRHRYAIHAGRPCAPPGEHFSSLETLASAFAWEDGHFSFDLGKLPSGGEQEPLSFIYHGIGRHMPARRIMQELMPHMHAYPTRTNLWSQRSDSLNKLSVLWRFIEACDGQTTLEQALASLGADATEGFQAALFATQIDLLMLRPQPTPQGISVQYNREIARFQQQQVDEQKKASKAYRARGTGRVSMERELAEFLRHIEHASPYQIFGVWEGCGREIIQTKFYEMVKLHHPDVYGGNISGDVKRLAQEIFITLKDTYQELIKIEREQTRPRPEPAASARARESSAAAPGTPGASSHETTFGAEPAATGQAHASSDSTVRQSRIERLQVKRSSTPIGLSREPSVPMVESRPRPRSTSQSSDARQASEARQAKLAKIRSHSSPGKVGSTGALKPGDTAANAFNEGYSAWRENQNVRLAAERFSTAYNLEPGNAKYMTFYGYFLFLSDAGNRDDAQRILARAIELEDRQSLPDAHVFMGHLLKVKEKHKEALKHYRQALKLNPKSRDAQREIRLYEKRHKSRADSESVAFLKNLFKK
jgi:tetratricopeptide (TPR) repeat protein